MGTRSAIGKFNPNGTMTLIYCHWDGYPSYNGRILNEHYKTLEDVDKLLALGDLSSLGAYPRSDPSLWDLNGEAGRKYLPSGVAEICRAYNDRGEDTHSRTVKTLKEAFDKYSDCKYFYLFGSYYLDGDKEVVAQGKAQWVVYYPDDTKPHHLANLLKK